ncbi:hypothetical protein B9Z19DRAFT_927639, partial [Tuber borchii]
LRKWSRYCVHAVVEDNLSTTAEHAFTATGFSVLLQPIAGLYELPDWPRMQDSSGTSYRWQFGGNVGSKMRQVEDWSDENAAEVEPVCCWPDMK